MTFLIRMSFAGRVGSDVIWRFDAEDTEEAQIVAARVVPKRFAKFCRVVAEGESK